MDQNPNSINGELTPRECEFIINLIGQLTISPAAKEAEAIVEIVKSILSKLTTSKE